jgi:hypothetical protein
VTWITGNAQKGLGNPRSRALEYLNEHVIVDDQNACDAARRIIAPASRENILQHSPGCRIRLDLPGPATEESQTG